MHICPDEIVPALGVIGLVPYCCRWCWMKVKGVFRR